jgi:hypothetical protein
MNHLDGLLAGPDVTLTDDFLDRIDEIVPPGTDVGTLDQAYQPAGSQPGNGKADRTAPDRGGRPPPPRSGRNVR